jgi:hypothetical protein
LFYVFIKKVIIYKLLIWTIETFIAMCRASNKETGNWSMSWTEA